MDQKRENLLNLALETPLGERIVSGTLNVGYESETRTWELIVKYHGDLTAAAARVSAFVVVETLIAGYAVLTVPESLVNEITNLEEVEYIELPKKYFYSQADFFSYQTGAVDYWEQPCFAPLTLREPFLAGRDVLLLVADSGIDWKREDFRDASGRTRIRYLWDQTLEREFDAEWINAALEERDPALQYEKLPSVDASGHGTAVTGLAAGYNRASGYRGIASGAELLIVKLGVPKETGFPRTTQLMRAVSWGLRKAEELKKPLVVNLSFGNCYGAHNGSSLLERFLNAAAEIGRTVVCVGSGNEADASGHVAGRATRDLGAGMSPAQVQLAVGNYERSLSVQFWQSYTDEFRIFLTSPGGERAELSTPFKNGKSEIVLESTRILVYQGEPAPYRMAKELYVEFLGMSSYITGGIWNFSVEPVKTLSGKFDFYLSDSAVRGLQTRFFTPSPETTLTIPSSASGVITVGAYDPESDSYADFSGRGNPVAISGRAALSEEYVKPDLVAPGVGLTAPDLYGGYQAVTGTSFAVPLASGTAALMMEWGIVRQNDPFLYGEKVKAYLRAGAGPLRGELDYPNEKTGWGKLCAVDSLPV